MGDHLLAQGDFSYVSHFDAPDLVRLTLPPYPSRPPAPPTVTKTVTLGAVLPGIGFFASGRFAYVT